MRWIDELNGICFRLVLNYIGTKLENARPSDAEALADVKIKE